jgi:hypothetical protein
MTLRLSASDVSNGLLFDSSARAISRSRALEQ